MGELERLLANEPELSQVPPQAARPQSELQRLLAGDVPYFRQGSSADVQVPLAPPTGPAKMGDWGHALQNLSELGGKIPGVSKARERILEESQPDLTFKKKSELERLAALPGEALKSLGQVVGQSIPEHFGDIGLMGAAGKVLQGVSQAGPAFWKGYRAPTIAPKSPIAALPAPSQGPRPPTSPVTPNLPARIEPPEPPERLGADGTYRYEPWRQNYDVWIADWKDPNLSWWDKFKRRLPADYNIATKHPESPVIGILDRPATELMNWTDTFVRSPEMKELSKLDAQLFVDEEHKAYEIWTQSRRPGLPTSRQITPQPGQVGMQIVGLSPEKSFDDIMQAIDPRVRPWFELFRDRMKVDQQSRAILGLDKIDEVPYPYLPRIGQQDWDRIMTLYRGDRQADAVSQLSTTIKGFQQARVVDTYSQGLQKGILYEDPKRAIIMRYVLSKQMEYTAAMMQELKGKVLFPSKAAAQAELYRRRGAVTPTVVPRGEGSQLPATTRAAPSPLDQPVAVRGLPGPQGEVYWIPSKDEALSLHQHLSGHQATWGQYTAVLNQFFRNPNLFNPAPHVIKNMGYKYVVAATGLGRNPVGALGDLAGYTLRMPADFFNVNPPVVIGRLARDAAEYANNLNPRAIAEFNHEMPFSRTAQTAYENLKPFLETNKAVANAQLVAKYLTGNSWSSKYIFSKADPAMKYSLWKMYREKGMSPTGAANQVNIDLIRYTLRSDLTDTWKNVPLNFFVPWRTGTVMATAKQLSTEPWTTLAKQAGTRVPAWAFTRPIKTSLLIGAILLGREAYYRDSGHTFHLPFDYVDGPITQLVTNPLTMPNIAASWYVLGPGGNLARIAGQFKDIFNAVDDPTLLMNMYWGIAQIYGGAKQFNRFAETFEKEGIQGADYSALAHLLMSAAFAEYESYGYKPKHLEHLIPKELLPYNPAVEKNISDNAKRAEAMETRKPKQQLRREGKQKAQHERVHGKAD